MSKIRNIIIILVLIILIIFISIILLYLKQNNEANTEELEGDVGEVIEITDQIEDVDNIGTFKSVELCIQKYYNMLNNESESFYGRNDDGQYERIVNDAKIRQMRLSLLSEEYIDKNNVNTNNIYQYIKTMNEPCTVIALKMKKMVNIPIEKYIVQAIVINYSYEVLDESYIIVNLDTENRTFSIEPISDNYNNIEDIKNINSNIAIQENDNNSYSPIVYNYEEIASNYFLTYKRLLLSKPEILYEYMDNEYRNKRWGSEENFKDYVTEYKNEITKLRFTEYLVNNKEDITQIVCKDQYGNLYIFNETLPMQFNLQLDTYTITTDNFRETYQNAEDEVKVQLDIDKFIKMINARDYMNVYNHIAEGFKNNYFNTKEEFEEYAKSFFFRYNKVTYKNIEKKGENIYITYLQIADLTEESNDIKELNVIVQLIDENNFIMSFEIQ